MSIFVLCFSIYPPCKICIFWYNIFCHEFFKKFCLYYATASGHNTGMVRDISLSLIPYWHALYIHMNVISKYKIKLSTWHRSGALFIYPPILLWLCRPFCCDATYLETDTMETSYLQNDDWILCACCIVLELIKIAKTRWWFWLLLFNLNIWF